MANISTDAVIDSILLKNQTSDVAAPASGYLQLYPKADALYTRASGGTIAQLGDALLAGRSGGQTLNGGIAADEDLILQGTSHATRTSSYLILQPNGGKVGIGTSTPLTALHVSASAGNAALRVETTDSEPNVVAQLRLVSQVDDWILSTSAEGGAFSITTGGTGISVDAGGGVLCSIMQLFNSGANNQVPTLYLQQNDDDIAMIEFDVSSSTPGAGKPVDTAAVGTYYGKVRVNVTNVGSKYIPLYNT